MTVTAVSNNAGARVSAATDHPESAVTENAAAQSAATPTAAGATDPLATRMATHGFHPAVLHSSQSPPAPGKESSSTAGELPADEAAFRAKHGDEGLRIYRDVKARKAEVEQAHEIYEQTGRIVPTKTQLARIEIMEGRLMSRGERYDAVVKAAAMNGTTVDRIAEYYLTPAEFVAETTERAFAAKNAAEAAAARIEPSKGRGVLDYVVDAADFVTDYTIPIKGVAKAGINGDYKDMAVLAASALPLPPAVKLGIVDGEVDMAKATLEQAKDAALGPVVAVADRANELRKGSLGGAFPDVAAAVAVPRDVVDGASKIAQGNVREGVRVATPAVLTVAGVVEAKLARPKGRTTAAGAEAPKQPATASVAEKPASADGQTPKSDSGAANGASRPMTQTNASLDTVDPRRLQNRAEAQQKITDARAQAEKEMAHQTAYQQRSAESAAHYKQVIEPTLPAPLKGISLETAIDGIAKRGWKSNIAFSAGTAEGVFRHGGGVGEAPAIFRKGNAIMVDWTQLTNEQRARISRAVESTLDRPRYPGVGDPTVNAIADTQPLIQVNR